MTPILCLYVEWVAWSASWLIAALWSARTQARPALGSQWPYRLVTTLGFVLIVGRFAKFVPADQVWRDPPQLAWSLCGVALIGFGVCWWARLHLGRLWSSSVTRKADHRIVDTGPYRLVRHPIYTGLIIAAAATAAVQGRATALMGLVVVIWGFWLKARLEERFLRAELGAEAYDAYAARTGMLAPGL